MITKRKNFNRYCCEDISLIENYNEAVNSDKLYDCHHRLELENEDGSKRESPLTAKDLNKQGLYYNRPAKELIFLEHSVHTSLHHKGKKMSEETKSKMRVRVCSEETRRKLSDAGKGRKFSDEAKKKMSEKAKNRPKEYWDNVSKRMKGTHLSEETKIKLSEIHKNLPEEIKKKGGLKNKGRHWGIDENGKRYWYD